MEPETERVDNSQVTDSDTAAQPQDDTNPETGKCLYPLPLLPVPHRPSLET